MAEALSEVGFTPAMQADRVAALSGGWKMKLALGEPPHLSPGYAAGLYSVLKWMFQCRSLCTECKFSDYAKDNDQSPVTMYFC